jgi:(1->4)-alpha-D-glucan 1-alpha-D-glucosylmutase
LGVRNSLVQTALKLTLPGVPDIYQGAELWDLSMTDPDNRRPVDYGLRARMLDDFGRMEDLLDQWQDGRIKLALIAKILGLRRENPELFASGDYAALTAEGAKADHVCAFVRRNGDQSLLVVAARFPAASEAAPDWTGTTVALPDQLAQTEWRDILTGAKLKFPDGMLRAELTFQHLPIAVFASVCLEGGQSCPQPPFQAANRPTT